MLKYLITNWAKILLSGIILISLIFSFISIKYFISTFGNSTLSHDTQKWAEFGNYFGGTLTTLFTLINVCTTIWLTMTVNKIGSTNTDNLIEAERKSATIHIRHEALKELRSELNSNYSTWKSDIYNLKFPLGCIDTITNFNDNYSYFFDNETQNWCHS